jgi:hypothetical protein
MFGLIEEPGPRRRRFQFRLRTLLIAVAVLALPCAFVGCEVKIVRERQAFLVNRAYIPAESSGKVDPKRAPWLLRLLGAESVSLLLVYGRVEFEQATSLFPEASITDMETVQRMPPP